MSKKQMTAKVPPHSIDAEKSFLGAVLITEDVLAAASDRLRPEDFYDKNHAAIYRAMVALYEHRRPVDTLTLHEELKKKDEFEMVGGAGYLAELTNYVPTAAHAEEYASMIIEKSTRRKLIRISGDIAELGYDEEKSADDLIARAETELFAVSDNNLKQDLVRLEDILSETFERLEELHQNRGSMRGVTTGWRDLDNMTAGLQRSDLVVLAARPAMGKTTLVTNLAYNVATKAKLPVLFFSLEMSRDQLVDRMLADASGVDSWNIRTGNLSDDDWGKLSHAMGEMADAPIFIDDQPGLTVNEMRTKARREAHNHPLGLVIVDYLQLMQASRSNGDGNRVQEVSEISRGLKLLARELNVPVVALSQLSRSVESRSPQIPQLSDLRESGSIEQDADIVMFIYREHYYNPETERQNLTDLIIAKHRNGPTGKVELYFHPERLRFMSVDRKHS